MSFCDFGARIFEGLATYCRERPVLPGPVELDELPVAVVRAADNHWYHCDDELPPRLCRHVSEVLRCQAYMLMCERR